MFGTSDNYLVEKALKGNKKAWFSLLSRYEKAIFNYGIRMTGNQDDAKDLLQEIFTAVFNSLSSYQQKSSFKSWLFKVAHFKCMDFYRRKKHHISLDDKSVDTVVSLSTQEAYQVHSLQNASSNMSPESLLSNKQTIYQILTLMQSLPFNQRVVVELKFFSQFTFDEISQQLDVSSNTVKSRLYAALAAMKNQMQDINMELEHG